MRENDFVIAICTDRFKEKSDRRGGGVGYEGDIMTAYAFTGEAEKKFIPVLRRGKWVEAAPTWLFGRAKIDLSGDPYSESEYEELLRTLHGAREDAPPIGRRPNFAAKQGSQAGPVPVPINRRAQSSAPRHQSSVTPYASDIPIVAPECPYRGLLAFREEDWECFCGRQRYVQQLVRMSHKPFVAVIGPSGSGKSSLMFAGLVRHLRTKENRLIAHFRPGNDPFGSLSAALVSASDPRLGIRERLRESSALARELMSENITVDGYINEMIRSRSDKRGFFLFADQFEELYSLCPDVEIRNLFLDSLLRVVDGRARRLSPDCILAITLCADFYGQALTHRTFSDLLQGSALNLPPMLREEARSVIEDPAKRCEVTFESGLVDRILDDVGNAPGNLPLLEFALELLWNHRSGDQLTHEAYRAIGGLSGAIAQRVDEEFETLSPAEQEMARSLFISLVRPGRPDEGSQDSRRRVTLGRSDESGVSGLVEALSNPKARLLVVDYDSETHSKTVEVAHEAVIQNWGRLRKWIDENRTRLQIRDELDNAAKAWCAAGRSEGGLPRGGQLAYFRNAYEPSEWAKEFLSRAMELESRREGELLEKERRLMDVRFLGDLRTLVEESKQMWPSTPDRISELEKWLATARSIAARLDEYRNKLNDFRRRAEPAIALPSVTEADDPPLLKKLATLVRRRQRLDDRIAGIAADGVGDASSLSLESMHKRRASLDGVINRLQLMIEEARPRSFLEEEDRHHHRVLLETVRRLSALTDDEHHEDSIENVESRLHHASQVYLRTIENYRQEWDDAIVCISDPTISPLYGGLRMRPQLGLVPVGRDSESGLSEFAFLRSGKVPRRHAGQRLILTESTAVIFVLIPAGTFRMGAIPPQDDFALGSPNVDPRAQPNESPVHAVSLDAFFISKYPMTQGQWRRITGRNPSISRPSHGNWSNPVSLLHPVENLSWFMCDRVLRRLGLALPTEAQWEYAARGGTSTVWWSGDDEGSLDGAGKLSEITHSPVGRSMANPFGLHDLVGGVWEWCKDSFGGYESPVQEADGERNVSSRRLRAQRGGSFLNTASSARSANRLSGPPGSRIIDLGVRPARRLDPL